jgi:S1-C subfamily serine protease
MPPPPGGGYGQPPSEPPTHGSGSRALVYLLVAVLAAAIGAGAVFALRGQGGSTPAVSSQSVPKPHTNIAGSGNAGGADVATAVARKVEPGMVDITARVRYQGQVFEGTGMVLTSSGLVLTNNHVVKDSTNVSATLVSDGRTYPAEIVGTDNAQDVALLKLVGASGLKTVRVGNSAKVRLDTLVVALGNAGGQGGSPTVTVGRITDLDRTITASDQGSGTSETLHDMFQTNASIAEGDSGGPLANSAGQVIAMNTAANTQSLGGPGTSQGFSIPIDRALAIARQIADGHAGSGIVLGQPAFLGIAIASNPRTDAASTAASPHQQLGQLQSIANGNLGGGVNSSRGCLSTGTADPVPSSIAPATSGTLIGGVFCGTPAAKAGAQAGDVITAVNGQSVGSPASLRTVMTRYHPGETVSLTWVDTDGHQHTGSLKLAAGPAA